jgi:hypothetical protein
MVGARGVSPPPRAPTTDHTDPTDRKRSSMPITGQDMTMELLKIMPANPNASAEEIKGQTDKILSELGFVVEDAYILGNSIVMMATQAQEPPEDTVVGAWITGIIVGAMMARKGGA